MSFGQWRAPRAMGEVGCLTASCAHCVRLQAVFMLISSDTLNFLCYFYYIKKFLFLAWEAES